MKQELLVTEFLEEIEQRAERFRGRLEHAFVDWFVEAEYGNVKWHFTDGPNDGGIDAVIWSEEDDPSVIIVQSKFSLHVGKQHLGAKAYEEFKGVVAAFKYGDSAFNDLLDRSQESLRKLYLKASDNLGSSPTWHSRKKAFRIITTNKRRTAHEFDAIPSENYTYFESILDLYSKYRIIQTPRPRQLELHVQDKLAYIDTDRKTTSYLFNARVSDFRRYLEKNDVSRLVARNIRYNLGGRIGRGIRETYEKRPKDFWYLHNGFTIVCDQFVENNQIAVLHGASVVNGAQSLYAISSSPNKDSPALVTVRVIVRGEVATHLDDDLWIQRVIRGVNTQNRVKNADFRSNDPEQAELQKKFKEQRVFYERKRGEWREVRTDPKFKGHAKITMQTLGQVLTSVMDDDGQGVLVVKRGTEAIFEDKLYKKLFPSRASVAFRFKRIYFAYRIFRLLDACNLGCRTQKEYRKRQHSFWNVLWLLHTLLAPAARSKLSVDQIRSVFDSFEGSGVKARRARSAASHIAKAVWRAYRTGRKIDPERWTANNFFKQKYGMNVIKRVALPKSKPAAKGLLSSSALRWVRRRFFLTPKGSDHTARGKVAATAAPGWRVQNREVESPERATALPPFQGFRRCGWLVTVTQGGARKASLALGCGLRPLQGRKTDGDGLRLPVQLPAARTSQLIQIRQRGQLVGLLERRLLRPGGVRVVPPPFFSVVGQVQLLRADAKVGLGAAEGAVGDAEGGGEFVQLLRAARAVHQFACSQSEARSRGFSSPVGLSTS